MEQGVTAKHDSVRLLTRVESPVFRQPPQSHCVITMINHKDKKRFRAIGHHLSPVVTIAGNGLSEGVLSELSRAVTDHELIKIKVLTGDREEIKETIREIQEKLGVEVVQCERSFAALRSGDSLQFGIGLSAKAASSLADIKLRAIRAEAEPMSIGT